MILRKKIQCRRTKNEWKKLPQPDQLIKFFYWCSIPDNGWCRTVLHDQRHWRILTIQWPVVSTHCQETKIPLNRKVGFEETPKNGPLLEFTTSYLQGDYGVEIRIEAVNKDNSHSWVRISHGLNKLVTDLSNNKENDNTEQETSEMQFEEFALRLNASDFASRSKAKAKPRRRTSACSSTRTVPICERIWTDIEPGKQSNIAYPVSEQLSTLLRHGHLSREDDGAIEFWRKRKIFGTNLSTLNIGLTICGRARWEEAEATSKIPVLYWSIRTRNSLSPSSSRSFRTQSHWSFITGRCINSERFLRVHLSHRMCNQITLHGEFRIDTGRTNFERKQTVFFTSVDPMNREHRDPDDINLNAPRLAW